MKKVLIGLLIVLLSVIAFSLVFTGMEVFGFQILGYKSIQTENAKLDSKIEEASKLTGIDYPAKLSDLESASKKLSNKKEEYKDKISYSSEEQIRLATQIKEFRLDFLDVKLGQYAIKEGVHLDLTFQKSSSTENIWSIHFIVDGQYIPISEFIRDIENDDELNFRLDGFSLKPTETSEKLRADFYIRNIGIIEVDNAKIINDNIVINKPTQSNTNTTNNSTNNTNNTTQNGSTNTSEGVTNTVSGT